MLELGPTVARAPLVWTDAIAAMATAWVYAVLLLMARSVPRRRDRRPAMLGTLIGLFVLSWSLAVWLRPWFGVPDGRAFPFAAGGLIASLVLASLSLPARRKRADATSGLRSPLFFGLVACAVIVIVCYYATGPYLT